MTATERIPFREFQNRVNDMLMMPACLHVGGSISVEAAMQLHQSHGIPCDEPEGIIYRVERNGKVDFLAKWVRPDKIDGKYLPQISSHPAVWNWRPT